MEERSKTSEAHVDWPHLTLEIKKTSCTRRRFKFKILKFIIEDTRTQRTNFSGMFILFSKIREFNLRRRSDFPGDPAIACDGGRPGGGALVGTLLSN